MSLLGRFNDLISGQPAGTSDQQAAISASVDAQEAAITAKKAANGDYTPEQLAMINADYASQPTESVLSQTGQLTGAALDGAAVAATDPAQVLATGLQWEGQTAGGVIKTVGGGLGSGLKGLFGGVPMWLWLVGAIALFIWLGGGGFVERRARGALSK